MDFPDQTIKCDSSTVPIAAISFTRLSAFVSTLADHKSASEAGAAKDSSLVRNGEWRGLRNPGTVPKIKATEKRPHFSMSAAQIPRALPGLKHNLKS